MTNLPLPTDSLYKFTALAGIIILLCSLFSIYKYEEIGDRVIKQEGEQKEIKIRREFLLEKTKFLSEELNRTASETNQLVKKVDNFSDPNQQVSDQQIKDVLNTVENIEKLMSQYLKKKIELLEINCELDIFTEKSSTKIELISNESKKFKYNIWIIWSMIFWGIFLSAYGFFQWYYKLQKYQDKIIKLQLEKLKE